MLKSDPTAESNIIFSEGQRTSTTIVFAVC